MSTLNERLVIGRNPDGMFTFSLSFPQLGALSSWPLLQLDFALLTFWTRLRVVHGV
jgi:hypothetical protein